MLSADGSLLAASSPDGGTASEAIAPATTAPDGGSDAEPHDPSLPDASADANRLCVVITPGYGCPAGFPYRASVQGMAGCCNAP